MPTVADIVRAQRQAIAEANSAYRYDTAVGTMQSAAETATLRASMAKQAGRVARSTSFGELMEMRAKNEVDASLALAKKMGEPCPTGYARNSMGECAVIIDQLTQRSTEYNGPTLLQNIESYDFMSDLKRPTVLPGASVVSTLQGLGFDIESPPCSSLVAQIGALVAKVEDPNNCQLFSTREGRAIAAKVRAASTAILRECASRPLPAPAPSRGADYVTPTGPKGALFDAGQWSSPSSSVMKNSGGMTVKPAFSPPTLRGLGYGMQTAADKAAQAAQRKDEARRATHQRVISALGGAIDNLFAKYPNVRGACRSANVTTAPVIAPTIPQAAIPPPTPPAPAMPPVVPSMSPTVTPSVSPAVPQMPIPELPSPEKAKSFAKKYWWLILAAGGYAWYTYGKK